MTTSVRLTGGRKQRRCGATVLDLVAHRAQAEREGRLPGGPEPGERTGDLVVLGVWRAARAIAELRASRQEAAGERPGGGAGHRG